MNRFEQANWVAERLKDYGLSVQCDHLRRTYRIGSQRYNDPIGFTLKGVNALQLARVPIPNEVLARPDCLLAEDRAYAERMSKFHSKGKESTNG